MNADAIKAELTKITLSVSAISQLLNEGNPEQPTIPVVTPQTGPVLRSVTIGNLIGKSVTPVGISDTPYVWYHPRSNIDGYLAQDFWGVVKVVAQRIYDNYPDRPERRLEMLLASPPKSGWTSATHASDGYYMDVAYYRRYVGDGSDIWTPDGTLDLTQFDVQRNKDFVKMIHLVFPRSRIMIDDRIKPALGLVGLPNEWLIPDPVSSGFSHDTHMHVWRGPTADYGVVI